MMHFIQIVHIYVVVAVFWFCLLQNDRTTTKQYYYVASSIPSEPHYYTEQLIDHFDDTNNDTSSSSSSSYWTQRYYIYDEYFNGPGSPIFVILGGEGSIEPSVGILYPFVVHTLAKFFGAYVLQIEHRFYGTSYPISRTDIDLSQQRNQPDPRNGLFTYEQALYDAARLIQNVQINDLQCSIDHTSTNYCPVITVGGSYPGFLSAMMRIVFPNIIDIAYAASAPMKFYSQQIDDTNSDLYYQHITSVTNIAVPGCATAVQTTLRHMKSLLYNLIDIHPEKFGICQDSIPTYCYQGDVLNREILVQEINMIIGYTFANANMAYYPPNIYNGTNTNTTTTTRLEKICSIFMNRKLTTIEKLQTFFTSSLIRSPTASHYRSNTDKESKSSSSSCFNMSSQLPHGKNATISSGDWSGVGTYYDGDSWDYQTCTLLIEHISFNHRTSMFLQRNFSLSWLQQHCANRYNNVPKPQPYTIKDKYHIDDLASISGLSNILFTNGLNDGWSVSGIQDNVSDTVIAINFPNGAHHSDLSGIGPSDHDTTDLRYGYIQIQSYIHTWLQRLPGGIHSLSHSLQQEQSFFRKLIVPLSNRNVENK